MKVIHLPTDVGGNSWGLSRGERTLGLESDVFYTSSSWIGYPYDFHAGTAPGKFPGHKMLQMIGTFLDFKKKYDVFHFNSGTSLIDIPAYGLPNVDLPFYGSDKKLFVTYNGSDARLRLRNISPEEGFEPSYLSELDKLFPQKRVDYLQKKIEKTCRWVRHVWALNPDLATFLPKDKTTFLPYTPTLNGKLDSSPSLSRKTLRFVHAPTSTLLKGSKYILEVMDKLKTRYPDTVEFELIQGVSHTKALEMYSKADIVIDQLVLGWYGGLAVEVMAMGKPVVVNMAKDTLDILPGDMRKDALDTLIHATPATLEKVLCELIENRGRVAEFSARGEDYANDWHSPSRVARITKKEYES